MKHLILVAAILAIGTVSAFALKGDDTPAAVKTKFAAEYPTVKKVKWENEDGKFEAHFEMNEVETSATYDATGKKLETEVEIQASALPKGVMEYVNKNYPGEKIKETAKITDSNNKVTYEAEVKAGDLIFDSNGKFVELKGKSKEKDEDGEDDDDDKKK